MKKIFLIIVFISLCWGVINSSTIHRAPNVIPYNDLYYTITYGSHVATLTSNPSKYKGNIIIPPYIYHAGPATGWKNIKFDVNTIGFEAFSDCDSLLSVSIPSSVTKIASKAFNNCKLLTSFVIPEQINQIGGASSINGEMEAGTESYAFNGCINCKNIYVYRKSEFPNAQVSSTIRVHFPYNFVSSDSITTVWYASDDCNIRAIGPKRRFVPGAFEVIESRDFFSTEFSLPSYPEYPERYVTKVMFDGQEVNPHNNIYEIRNLQPGSTYSATAIVHDRTTKVDTTVVFNVKTTPIDFDLTLKNSTQTTLTFKVSATNKGNTKYSEIGIYYYDKYYPANKDNEVILKGLKPNQTGYYQTYAIYNGIPVFSSEKAFSTKPIELAFDLKLGASSIVCKAVVNSGDAEITKAGFVDYKTDSDELILTGLDPKSSVYISYSVQTKDNYTTKIGKTISTLELELKTQQPMCVSNSCAIVAATTNITDDESNVGFQWKKYDAPESLAPNEGYAAIYDGKLEGYIKNLQATSYYKVRAFYKSNTDRYYYGEWITFDPSDFSYFEPTVHTYPAYNITHNSVKVKGYILAGTDAIIEQGFQYWELGTNKNNIKEARGEAPVGNISTIISSGQVMTANIEGLKPNTTYVCRAFVKTDTSTKLGEEISFITQTGTTEIEDIEIESLEPFIIGYYNINGYRFNTPQKGMNIIKYSDGSVKKIIVH